jgi:hypothetical protein
MILLVALAMATSAWAQAPAPKKEPAKAPAQTEAAKEPAKAEVQKPATVAKKSRRQQDARHCLERGSNIEIIKCAEEYL